MDEQKAAALEGAWSAQETVTGVSMGPAHAYCEAVRVVYQHLAGLKPGLRLAAITAVTELLADAP